MLKKHRKARKLKYKEYKKNLFDQLDLLRDSDPKSYWSLLEKLNHLDKPSSSSPSDEIPGEEWFRYFKSLNKNNKNVDSSFLNKLKDLENVKIFTELDCRISNKEIINAISSLKNNKASSFDQILNEMLKFGQTYIIDPLCKLFNNILSTGKFPVVWAKGIIVPIFKSGEKCNPSNYRGITIGSCIGKLFLKILNNRLDNFLTMHNIICPEQIGFSKGSRTSDHMFVLKTLIDKYTQQGSKH